VFISPQSVQAFTANMLSGHVSAVYRVASRRVFHTSRTQSAISPFTMPAMSPTMTEGGIASWKKKEGESFVFGDVLLEIETDKATMDVEAQDDGILGKIVLPDGSKNVPVGKIIAFLAEDGDDISDLTVPKEESPSTLAPVNESHSRPPPPSTAVTSASSSPASIPSHAVAKSIHNRPLFPSVLRLLRENDVDGQIIKGTGVRGMLTKGDVLAHIGKASSPWGTGKDPKTEPSILSPAPWGVNAAPEAKSDKVLDSETVRRMIVAGLVEAASPAPMPAAQSKDLSFYDILNDYDPSLKANSSLSSKLPLAATSYSTDSYFDGLI